MAILSDETVNFAYAQLPWQEDEYGYYFPDQILAPFISAAAECSESTFDYHLSLQEQMSPLNRHRILLPDLHLDKEQSHELVISALKRFDPTLGQRASDAMKDSSRWNTGNTKAGNASGCCYPANTPDNNNPFAVIHYEYDGTINDPVYIAHELGHLLADDGINAAGFSCYDSRSHMAEVQAFFVQCVLYDDLINSDDLDLRKACVQHYIGEMSRNLYDISIGVASFEADHIARGAENEAEVSRSYEAGIMQRLGTSWRSYDKAVFVARDINDPEARDQKGMSNIHQHAMASALATGLFWIAKQMSADDRSEFIDSLMGRNGPKSLSEVVKIAQDKTGLSLTEIADQSMKLLSEPVYLYEDKYAKPAQANASYETDAAAKLPKPCA